MPVCHEFKSHLGQSPPSYLLWEGKHRYKFGGWNGHGGILCTVLIPSFPKDVAEVGKGQKVAIQRIKGLKSLLDEGRLKDLSLFSCRGGVGGKGAGEDMRRASHCNRGRILVHWESRCFFA